MNRRKKRRRQRMSVTGQRAAQLRLAAERSSTAIVAHDTSLRERQLRVVAATRSQADQIGYANLVLSRPQRWIGIGLVGTLVGLFIVAPASTGSVAMFAAVVGYLGAMGSRVWWSWWGAGAGPTEPDALTAASSIADDDLPPYTILVPVFNEASLMPGLIAALTRLDYPPCKLDVLILLEDDDVETRRVLETLRLPSCVRLLTVPERGPQGKPRACNVGLAHARGEILVIYDAEDIPEPDQLRKVVAAFRSSEPKMACVQCKLDFFNADENLLTRWFAGEFAAWFDLYLPGLQRARLPIPLGGSSNHFSTAMLRELGGWDPYNVTEDADLGMRLARAGRSTQVIDSTTWEEANTRIGNWIRQRSRWMKGYVITWLVHMRHPLQLYRDVGLRGFVSIQLTLGMSVGIALINPVFWLLALIWPLTHADAIDRLFAGPTFYVGLTSLVVGNWAMILTVMIACYRRRHFRVVKYTLLLPIYWILMSVAAWKGVFQLWRRPAYWEKTEHGLTAFHSVPADSAVAGRAPAHFEAASQRAISPSTATPAPRPRTRAVQAQPARTRRPSRAATARAGTHLFTRTDVFIWLVLGLLASIVGIWASLHQHAHHGDALARTYAAVQVIDGHDPKLANLGLVWPGLPTLLQVPLVAIAPSLASNGATGPIVSSFALGACVMLLNQILCYYLPARRIRWLVLALFFVNPLMLQLTLSGMSEMLFLSFVLLGWRGVEEASRNSERVLTGTVMAALGASGAFLCRFEGATLGVALMTALIGLLIARERRAGTLRQAIPALEASVVIFLTCFGYVIALFLLLNYIIMGDALYFATGTGSIDQMMTEWLQNSQTVSSFVGDPVASAAYAVMAIWCVFAGLLLIVPIALVTLLIWRDLRLGFLLVIALIPIGQQVYLTYGGQSPGWERYYVASAVVGVILITSVTRTVTEHLPRAAQHCVLAGCVMLVCLSSVVAWTMEGNQRVASDFSTGFLQRAFALPTDDASTVTEEDDARRIAAALNETIFTGEPNALILVDDLKATAIVLFAGKPANFVVSNNRHFDAFVADPVGSVQYFLLPESPRQNVILEQHPAMLSGGVPFLTLVATYQEVGGDRDRWRLYRVDATALPGPDEAGGSHRAADAAHVSHVDHARAGWPRRLPFARGQPSTWGKRLLQGT